MKKRLINLFALLAVTITMQAQVDTRPTHYIGIDAGAGYSHLFFGDIWKPYQSVAKPLSGWGVDGSLFYEFEYQHFLLHAGFGVQFVSGRNRLPIGDYTATIQEYPSMAYHYSFSNFTERTRYAVAHVPIMVGGQWEKAYFLVGAKLGVLPFGGNTKSKSQVQTWATDDDIIDPLYNLPTHDMRTFDIQGTRQAVKYSPFNAMLSAEVGLNLDKRAWANEKERKRMDRAQRYHNLHRKKTLRERTHVRIALFADYGVSNLHSYQANPVPEGENATGGIVAFNGLTDLQPYSMLGYSVHQNVPLHNFLLGVKVAVRFEMPKKAPKKGAMANPYLYVYTTDETTATKLPGTRVQIFEMVKKHKVRLDKTTDTKYGRVGKALPAGTYKIYASRGSHLPVDTITYQHRDAYDTLYVALYPYTNLKMTVTDALSLRPIAAQVTISKPDGTIVARTTSDSLQNVLTSKIDGRETYIIRATAENYEPFVDTIAPNRTAVDVTMEPIKIRSFVLHNMYFATAKTRILPSSENALQELYEMLAENPDVTIRIVGYTDDVGSDESNQVLSEGRAKSVRQEMIKRGIDGKRIKTTGHGEKDPIAPNDSEVHRQMNRRVEIEVLTGTVHIHSQQ